MRARRIALLIFSLSVLVKPAVSAQSAGNIAGVVRDLTGAVLPGVTVEAASPALIEKVRSVVTDGQGQYQIIDLRPGTYTVTFRLVGFTTMTRDGIQLTTGFTANVNAELRIGSVEETITVSGASPVVDVRNARVQNVLSRDVLDTLPTGKTIQGWASLTLGTTIVQGGQDVGGNRGEAPGSIAIHGGRHVDQRVFMDGMTYNIGSGQGSGYNLILKPNQMATHEITLETSGGTAESESSGIQVNLVPKEGSNRFSGSFVSAYTGKALQSDNLSDALRARALTSTSTVKRIYDVGGSFGGPISQNRLWFFASPRWWGAEEYAPGNYFNKTPHTLFYTPDFSRQAYHDTHQTDMSVRLTWQASQKQKFTIGEALQHNCVCYDKNFVGGRSPEAMISAHQQPMSLTQVVWTYPAASRLLLQGGVTYLFTGQKIERTGGVTPTDIPITELSTNYAYGASTTYSDPDGPSKTRGRSMFSQANSRLALSYVTGSHAFKTGFTTFHAFSDNASTRQGNAISYSFRKPSPDAAPVPVSVTYYSNPIYSSSRATKLALYADDQWTLTNLTLNLGVRFDSLHAWNPPQSKPSGIWVPGFDFPRVDNVPNWKDISPRLGAAYDLFGNGRTAVKVSVGRYMQSELTSIASATNGSSAIVSSATRTWTDANGDYVPQDSELGPLSNSQFGTVVINRRYADDVLKGWGIRPYNWSSTVALQHELRPGFGLKVGYYRRSYGNFMVTDNLSVTPADYDHYCVTAPSDARLPGGGGNQLCGLYDIKPTSFGAVDNLITRASHYGKETEVYDGIDFEIHARFGTGGLVAGGVSTGHTITDDCFTVDSPQALRPEFCHVVFPFEGQTQIKLNGVYPLPWWGVRVSGVFQNLAGIPTTGNPTQQGLVFGDPIEGGTYVATNAEIAPSLGRNLGACGTRASCSATATISLVPPYSQFERRLTQLDLRVTKIISVRGVRVQGMFDAYNVFNANTLLALNTRYGSEYLQPTQILAGRLFKFSAQLDF